MNDSVKMTPKSDWEMFTLVVGVVRDMEWMCRMLTKQPSYIWTHAHILLQKPNHSITAIVCSLAESAKQYLQQQHREEEKNNIYYIALDIHIYTKE